MPIGREKLLLLSVIPGVSRKSCNKQIILHVFTRRIPSSPSGTDRAKERANIISFNLK
ncbi:MAG: hypothetical protein Q7T80_00790 [Methanoregula sp.]|nr:hypothetical protein [Methanoregula sp.]